MGHTGSGKAHWGDLTEILEPHASISWRFEQDSDVWAYGLDGARLMSVSIDQGHVRVFEYHDDLVTHYATIDEFRNDLHRLELKHLGIDKQTTRIMHEDPDDVMDDTMKDWRDRKIEESASQLEAFTSLYGDD